MAFRAMHNASGVLAAGHFAKMLAAERFGGRQ
jgi:hypothetical protein